MWKAKQRVLSRTEPELGCGIVRETSSSWVDIYFPLKDESRRYGHNTAPIQRYALTAGQTFYPAAGEPKEVTEVKNEDGILTYITIDGEEFGEWLMDHNIHDQGTLEQLYGGQISHHNTYELRREAWSIRSEFNSSPVNGLVGPRVSPLSHQLFIAEEVVSRPSPRVLLADEVGLGKTIEAGLIMSALKHRGRADRILIVVPEALIFQWVHEIYRKFNLLFSVLDEERIKEDESTHGEQAFKANHLCIIAMEWLVKSPDNIQKITEAKFDLLVMDEAHHIRWDYEEPSAKWVVAKKISDFCNGVLLLTATPRQYGFDTQFGLLNIVDPDRYSDFDKFLDEAEFSKQVASIAKKLVNQFTVPKDIADELSTMFNYDLRLIELLKQSDVTSKEVIKALVDRHGTGRVLFRNRRANIKGFPQRSLIAVPVEPSEQYKKRLNSVNADDAEIMEIMDYATGRSSDRVQLDDEKNDSRLSWITHFIAKETEPQEKILIICATIDSVLRVANHIESNTGLQVAIFHEKLSVIERDQEAAMFADNPKCKVLISSEIGGEGRNFQFANKLIMGDIPRHPDLVEQRIGRLDRIGQTSNIKVFLPYYKGTLEEVLFTWYEEGLKSFTTSWNGTDVFLNEFAEELFETLRAHLPNSSTNSDVALKMLDQLVHDTQRHAEYIRQENENSVDLLVDLNSYQPEKGEELLDYVEEADDNPTLEFFIRSMFEHYGVDYEEYDDRGTLLVKADSMKFIDKFPGIEQDENTLVTFDREVALLREDIVFATGDHPIADGALSLLLDRNEGVASMAKWPDSPYENGLIVEISMVFEALGPKDLELGRFLPILTKELQFNHTGKSLDEKRHKDDPSKLVALGYDDQRPDPEMLKQIIEPIVEKAQKEVGEWSEKAKNKAISRAEKYFESELSRLQYLSDINRSVSSREIDLFKERAEESLGCLKDSNPRIDGIRLVFTS